MSSSSEGRTSKSKNFKIYGVPAALGLSALLFLLRPQTQPMDILGMSALNIPSPKNTFGINIKDYEISEDTILSGDIFSGILTDYGVPYSTAMSSAVASKDIMNVKNLRAGKAIKLLKNKKTEQVDAMIYESSAIEYVVFHLSDSVYTERIQKPVDTVIKTSAGIIESSLWNAIMANNIADNFTANLGVMMEDAYAWTIDFHHLQKGDNFKLVYEELYVDGKLVALGQLKSAYFEASGKDFYAIRYKSGKYDGYYDLNAKPMKRGFRMAPVEYTRISSRYSPRRYHPVLKRYKSHLGTDFAAPHGTPIVATGAGVIIKRSFTKGNGNYVKIKHDDTYSTQYLHMSSFAKGQKVGTHVRQGEVIGYVGSTGYATGPHVCYRFWKNGKQIDPLRIKYPEPDPLPSEEIPSYIKVKNQQKGLLDQIEKKTLQSNKVDSTQLEKEVDPLVS